MKLIANLIIPFITIFVLVYGLIKKVDVYDSFIKGVKEGLSTSLSIFPTIMAMIISINLLINSNIILKITNLLSPILFKIGFPSEVLMLALLRPISSSSSLIVMDNLLKVHGVDSYIGRLSSIIQGSTDTTIYILGMYFSSVGIKKIKYSLFVGLLADLSCVIIATIVVNIFA